MELEEAMALKKNRHGAGRKGHGAGKKGHDNAKRGWGKHYCQDDHFYQIIFKSHHA